jgi:flagellar biosynthesis chaperone FliJ
VDELLQQQMQLVKSGVLSAQDAINYCQFLSKIMPEMDQQINRYIQQLEKL